MPLKQVIDLLIYTYIYIYMYIYKYARTQNTVLHIMHFLRLRVAKAPYIFESQLISSNSTVTPTFLYLINVCTFFILLCICSIHL